MYLYGSLNCLERNKVSESIDTGASLSVSVVIPTYNGAKTILGCLGSLRYQTFKDFEVVVVVDGSTDDTAARIKEATTWFDHLNIIERTNGGRATARNTGAQAASGDLLVFLDDDMKIEKDVIEAHCQHAANYPDSILVGGTKEEIQPDGNDMHEFKVYKSKIWESVIPDYPQPLAEEQVFLTAAHCSMSRTLFHQIGMFNNTLNDAEDLEFAIRSMQKGVPIYCNTNLEGRHYDVITAKGYVKRLRQYSAAHISVQSLHSGDIDHLSMPDRIANYKLKKPFYWIFSHKFWLNTIDHFNWLKMLPRAVRFKVYDIILAAYSVYYPNRNL